MNKIRPDSKLNFPVGSDEVSLNNLQTYFADYQLGQFLLSCDYTNQKGWNLYNEGCKLQPPIFRNILKPPLEISDIKGKKIAIISPFDYIPKTDGAEHPEFRYMMGSYQIILLKPLADLLKLSPQNVKLIVDSQFVELLKISYPQIEVIALPKISDTDQLDSMVHDCDYVLSVTQLGCYPKLALSFEKAKPHIKADEEMVKHFTGKLRTLCQGKYPLAISWSAPQVAGAVSGKSIRVDVFFNHLLKLKDKFAFIDINFQRQAFDLGVTSYFAKQIADSNGIYINAYKEYKLHGQTANSAALICAINRLGGAAVSIANFLEAVTSSLGTPEIKLLNYANIFNYGLGRGFGEDTFSRKPWVIPVMQTQTGQWEEVIETALDLLLNHYNPHNPLRFDYHPDYNFMLGKKEYYQAHYRDKTNLSIRDISQHWR